MYNKEAAPCIADAASMLFMRHCYCRYFVIDQAFLGLLPIRA